MSKIASIPESLQHHVITWSGEGKSAQIIIELLRDQHQVKTTIFAVYRLLKKVRQERQELAKAKYTEELEKTANQDIKIMSDIVRTYYNKWKKCKDEKLALSMAAELRMWIRDKMSLVGIEHNDNPEIDESIKDELINELEELKNSQIKPN